jgi:hypothetical protein
MVTVFGKQYSRVELEKRIGHLSQIAGVRMMELKDGHEAGVRIAEFRTGSGLRFQVSLDRGMDISVADFKGMPLAWRSAVGDVHPHLYIPAGTGWLRSFAGGLMTGCGISQAGAACVDEGQELPMHGRLSHTPAYNVHASTVWNGDQCFLRLEGFVREYSVFHENLSLHRVIECELGGSVITLRDTVSNDGSARTPLMMLYHCNIGWPLVDAGSALLVDAKTTEPRDEQAKGGLNVAHTFSGPEPGYKEQVFFHELLSDKDGFATALLANRAIQRGIFVRFRLKELPRFIEWKMMGEGTFVVGLEPANCLTRGRLEERKRGTLQFLEPGERREFVVQIGLLEGQDQLSTFVSEHNLR